MGRRLAIILLMIVLALSVTACGRPRKVMPIDMEKAQIDLIEYCKRISSSSQSVGQVYLFDLNKDNVEELCTSVEYGVENIRSAVVVYDVYDGVYYTLSSEYVSYSISRIDRGRLIVYEDEEVKGTVVIDGDSLVFVADKK
ncbi:MAG: hypothetical protein K6E12_06350 [Saccharofermentans sp.]|nr:hypothetical protein [Saccharofermentans sp.]